MRFAVVIPVGPGRDENLAAVMKCLSRQTRPPDIVVVVFDGRNFTTSKPGVTLTLPNCPLFTFSVEKHEPGMEQPRNVGTRLAVEEMPGLTHVAFLDSDVVVADDWLELIEEALEVGEPRARILVAPYDWLGPGIRPELDDFWDRARAANNDPRWAMFHQHGPDHVYRGDLSAGLACFSGNLVWPVKEFMRVGGFWSEIHHGRCEDGELGLRAVAMDVPISLCAVARGWHLHHPVNTVLAEQRNRRDVPLLNDRHPWVEGHQVFMVDRDGKAFDVLCSRCHRMIPTIGWWQHAPRCGVNTALTA